MSGNDDQTELPEILLEETNNLVEPETVLHDPLFGDESFALTAGKFVGADLMLKALTRDLRFTDFLREILLVIMRVVKTEAGSILEVDHAKKHLFFRAVVGQSSDSITRFTVPIGQGIAGYVAESLQPLVAENIAENRQHLKEIEKAVGFETRNLVALPLVIRGKIFGVIEVLNRVGSECFTPTDVELLNYLCEAASRAIEVRLMLNWAVQRAGGSPQNPDESKRSVA